MKTALVEATNGMNWGKFLVAQFTYEWLLPSHITAEGMPTDTPLLLQRGWTPKHLLVLDIETGEGAFFRTGGLAHADLMKHAIWVCPLFEPFLQRVYQLFDGDVEHLPPLITFTEEEAPFFFAGVRRGGPTNRDIAKDMLTRHIAHMDTRHNGRALTDAARTAEQILGTLAAAGIRLLDLDARENDEP